MLNYVCFNVWLSFFGTILRNGLTTILVMPLLMIHVIYTELVVTRSCSLHSTFYSSLFCVHYSVFTCPGTQFFLVFYRLHTILCSKILKSFKYLFAANLYQTVARYNRKWNACFEFTILLLELFVFIYYTKMNIDTFMSMVEIRKNH